MSNTHLSEQVKLAIEQIYENESLTGNCIDESAKQILSWGEAQLTDIGECDPETFDQYLNKLQRTMRTVNRLVGKQTDLSEADLVKQLLRLVDRTIELSSAKTATQSNDDKGVWVDV
ncbi:hypothetical protein QUF63_15730 [Anaerolineales bacterium HSG25]|nr:hypothetical protein [Anaerolineales bacterium HSG25]